MEKLLLPPDEDGYSVNENANTVASVVLDGGLPRERLDEIGGTRVVSLKWSGSKTRYSTVRAFFEENIGRNCPQFLLDLIVGESGYKEYICNVIPDTVNNSTSSALSWSISAQLEVIPRDDEADFNLDPLKKQGENGLLCHFDYLNPTTNEVFSVLGPDLTPMGTSEIKAPAKFGIKAGYGHMPVLGDPAFKTNKVKGPYNASWRFEMWVFVTGGQYHRLFIVRARDSNGNQTASMDASYSSGSTFFGSYQGAGFSLGGQFGTIPGVQIGAWNHIGLQFNKRTGTLQVICNSRVAAIQPFNANWAAGWPLNDIEVTCDTDLVDEVSYQFYDEDDLYKDNYSLPIRPFFNASLVIPSPDLPHTFAEVGSRVNANYGLAGVHRRNQLNNTSIVDVSWSLNADECGALQLMYRQCMVSGAAKTFKCDLCLDSTEVETYSASFVPGSFVLKSVSYATYFVSAKLKIKARPYNVINRPWLTDVRLKNIPIKIVAGSYLVTGLTVALRPSKRTSGILAPGVFELSNPPIQMGKVSKFTQSYGSYTLYGNSITAYKAKTLANQKGLFTLTGIAATLTKTAGVSLPNRLLHFDGTDGQTTTVDSSSSAVTVDLNGGILSTNEIKPKFGTACFNGRANYRVGYITLPIDAVNTRTGAFTLQGWFNFPYDDTYGIFSIGNLCIARNGSNLQIIEGVGGGSNTLGTVSYAFGLNNWHHIAFTFDGTTYKVWVDGELILSSTTLPASNSATSIYIGAAVYIGYSGFAFAHSNGYIDEAAYDPVCLYTASFIPQTAPFGTTVTTWNQAVLALNPTTWYKLDETSGTSFTDSSGNGNTGTSTGTIALGNSGLYSGSLNSVAFTPANNAYIKPTADPWPGAYVGSFTFVCELKITTTATIDIFGRGVGGSDWSLAVYANGSSAINLGAYLVSNYGTYGNVISLVTAAGAYTVGTTFMFAITWESGIGLKIYINGVLAATGAASSVDTGLRASSDGMYLARNINNQYAGQAIDESVWYNTALSSKDLAYLYSMRNS